MTNDIDEINKHLNALEGLTGLAGSDGKGYNSDMTYDKESQGQSGKSANSNPVDPPGRDPKDMTGKKSKKAKKAGEEEEEEGKEGMEDGDKEKPPMLAKKAKEDDEDNGKDAKIAGLTAQVQAQSEAIRKLVNQNTMITAKPLVEKMLSARANAGMAQKDLQAFERGLYGKSIDEIKTRFSEDQVLFENTQGLVASENQEPIPFNGGLSAAYGGIDSGKSLEEMLS